MKTLMVIVLLLGTTPATGATLDMAKWSWQRTIPVQAASGFIRLSIPPEVFDQSQAGLNDLRILDNQSRLVPHVIHWGRVDEVKQLEWRPGRLLNATYLPGEYARVTADFGKLIEKNKIMVGLSGNNYRRRALLEGSNDSEEWEVVAEDLWLFDISLTDQKFKLDTLNFPGNNFEFLRLTVYNMADDPERIHIQSVQAAFQGTEQGKELVPVPGKSITRSYNEKRNQSVFEIDLGFRNLPIVSLQCIITTPYFYRGYELLGRNQEEQDLRLKTESGWKQMKKKAKWRFVRRGVLFRTDYKNKISESVAVEDINGPYRYLQLRIFNEDNPPLELESIKIFRRDTSLVFEVQEGETYTLIGGNPRARIAEYDLAKSVRDVDQRTLPVLEPGEAILPTPKEEMVPWSERHGTAIMVVLIVGVGLMLILIVRNLKKLPPKQPD